MMTDSEELNHPHKAFLVNASERLEEIEQDLLSLKNDRNPDRINHLIQRTHALRGTAESLEFPTVVIVAHLLEEILNKLLNPLVIIDPELESLLLRGYECLKLPLKARLTRTQIEEPEILKWIIDIFAQLNLKLGHFDDRRHRGSSDESLDKPSATVAPGTDVVQAIFETWIGKRLANLAFTLAHADAEIVAAQLRDQCRVFSDISTQLKLKGFGDIAKVTVEALDRHPEQALTVAQIALADFLNGQTLVLSGDRVNGGQPSLKLQQLSYQHSESESPSQIDANAPSRSDQGQPPLSPPHSKTLDTSAQLDIDDVNTSHHLADTPVSDPVHQTAAHRTIQKYLQDIQGKLAQLQEKLTHFQVNYSAQQRRLGFKLGHRLEKNESALRLQPSDTEQDHNDIRSSGHDPRENSEDLALALSLLHSQTQQPAKIQPQNLPQVQEQEHLPQPREQTLESLFRRMPHLTDKWTEASGKQVEVSYQGHHVHIKPEMSRPLYHLILSLTRHAITFGIEATEVRRRLGKSERGQIHVTAEQQRDGLTLAISHDGHSLDFEQIRQQAVQMQLQSSEQAAQLSDPQLKELLLLDRSLSHFWDYSLMGLGKGFKYLLTRIYALNGSLTLHSTRELGTRLVVDLTYRSKKLTVSPSGLDTARHLAQSTSLKNRSAFVQSHPSSALKPQRADIEPSPPPLPSGSQEGSEPALKVYPNTESQALKTDSVLIWLTDSIVFALPYDMIVESVSPEPEQITQSEQHRLLQWEGQILPLYSLSELLNSTCKLPQTRLKDDDDAAITFVLKLKQRLCAVESRIKCLITKSEITIHPFSDLIQLPNFVNGCTVLEDNQIVFVVQAAALMQQTLHKEDSIVLP